MTARTFFKEMLRHPARTASVWPSSASLSLAMALAVPETAQSIVELGAGTGPVTKALRQQHPEASLMVVEANPTLGRHLRGVFPTVPVHVADARYLPYILRDTNSKTVDAVVSSLGLRAMQTSVVRDILTGVAQSLTPGGVFVQFTYGLDQPVPEELVQSLGWAHEALDRVWLNMPPARVHRYITRR